MPAHTPTASGCDEQGLLEYLEGSLPLHRRPLVEGHLERCEVCRRNLAGFEQTLTLTSTVSAPAMDPFISSGFGTRVRRRIGEYRSWRSWGRRWPAAFSGAIAGAATVILVLAGSDHLSFVEPEVPAAAGLQMNQTGTESTDSPGIEQFLVSVSSLYRDELEGYAEEALAESRSPDLGSEVLEYLLDTASEAELLEQVQSLADMEDLYASTME